MNLDEAFIRPDLLWGVAAAIVFSVICLGLERRRRRRIATLVVRPADLIDAGFAARRRRRAVTFAIAIPLVGVALAGPAGPGDVDGFEDAGVDVVFCIDVSASVLVEDVGTARLARARRAVSELSRDVGAGRCGLVAHAADAAIVLPPTRDLDALHAMLGTVDFVSAGQGAVDHARALVLARGALSSLGDRNKAIVLLTDGAGAGGTAIEAARRTARHGTPVHVIGIGTVRGGPVPHPGSGDGSPLRSASGAVVRASLAADWIRSMASAGGGVGVFLDGSSEASSEGIGRVLRREVTKAARTRRLAARRDRYRIPLLLALAFILPGIMRTVESPR